MIRFKDKKVFIPTIVVVMLLLTNPSHQEFRSHMRIAPTNYRNGTGRDYNFFVCSIYSIGDIKYVGVFGNFFKL